MSTVLEYRDVTFRRDFNNILKGVNWTVKKGEKWALLGQNGSGKSTLLSMVMAYTWPTSGEVDVLGKTFGKANWSPIKKRIGFVSSTLGQFQTSLNVEKVIDIVRSGNLNTIGLYEEVSQEDEKKAQQLMEQFHLNPLKNQLFYTLSEGERRKVLIARSFMIDSDLLILDEPCANLDLKAREELLYALNTLCKNSEKTIIFVTHSVEEIVPQTTHVALLHEGKILKAGEKKEVVTDENLSLAFQTDLNVHFIDERPWIIVKNHF